MAEPEERIMIDRQRAVADAAREMHRAATEYRESQAKAIDAIRSGDQEEAKRQREAASRAEEGIRSAANAAAEANRNAVEQLAGMMRESVQVATSTMGGFGAEGLENLPRMFAGQKDESAKQTELARLQLIAMRQIERHLRGLEPLAFD